MKNVKIVLIVFLGVIILGLCVLLGMGLGGRLKNGGSGWFGWNIDRSGNYQLVQEQEFPAEGIDSIRVEYTKSSNDVTVYEAEGDSVIVREYANYEVSDGELAQMKCQSGKLMVKGPRRSNAFFGININKFIYTEVYLPKDYAGELNINTVSGEISITTDLLLAGALNLCSTSGDIYAGSGKLQAEEINVCSTSGEIRLPVLEAGKVNMSTTSGDISVKEADTFVSCSSTSGEIIISGGAGDRRVSSTSGDVRVDGLSGSIQANTSSGEILIRGERGEGKLQSTSGDVLLSIAELTGDVSVNTSSGEVVLELPKTASLEFEASTTSGDINTFFDDDLSFSKKGNHAQGTVGSGERNVRITTTSGDVTVRAR